MKKRINIMKLMKLVLHALELLHYFLMIVGW